MKTDYYSNKSAMKLVHTNTYFYILFQTLHLPPSLSDLAEVEIGCIFWNAPVLKEVGSKHRTNIFYVYDAFTTTHDTYTLVPGTLLNYKI